MPGLMIMLALAMAPAVDPELKDPWPAAPRASATTGDLLDPFAPRTRGGHADEPAATGRASADLRDPFETTKPRQNGEPSAEAATSDLRNPFEANPPHKPTRAAPSNDLRNPFEASPAHKPTNAAPSSDLRNPFEANPPHKPTRAAELVDPFAASAAKRSAPSARARATSLELRNPFATPPRRSPRR